MTQALFKQSFRIQNQLAFHLKVEVFFERQKRRSMPKISKCSCFSDDAHGDYDYRLSRLKHISSSAGAVI